MAELRVSEGQSLLDISLWLLGGTDAVYALADANGLSITDALLPGQLLRVPDGYTVNEQLVKFLAEKKVRVNTANLPPLSEPEPESLVDWDETDFDNDDWF